MGRRAERGARLPAGRKAELATFVATQGEVTVAQLASQFDVSIDTIRRDLDQLDQLGMLTRTYGGAMSIAAGPRGELGVDTRISTHTEAKTTIGELAATLVHDGSAIMLNGGSTTLAAARALRNRHELTIATNNLLVPSEVAPGACRDLYVYGGSVRTVTQATIGPVTFRDTTGENFTVQCDLALIGVGAVSAANGYTTSNLGEATMMREMMAKSSRVAVLCDSSKFDKHLFAHVADLGAATYFVTDRSPADELATALAAAGVNVVTPEALAD
ncbi:MAG: DeoR/GlpR family DNA-binding transcription regulator [Arachnia sp.]